MSTLQQKVWDSLTSVANWVEQHDYKGYEPFEGNSSFLHVLTFNNLLLERCLQQAVLRAPFNVRPLIGIRPKPSTKGRGYMAWGYLEVYKRTGNAQWLTKAEACLDWLDRHKAPKFEKHSWSNHFDFAGRGGRYTKDDPIIVWTSLIGQAYLEAFEQTGHERWLAIADSACGWIMDLPREKTDRGDCISYLMLGQSSIHNANMLGVALLARTARHTGNASYQEVARSAMLYSCSRQHDDGSWWYAEAPKYHWIDNFHTGYNLDSLKRYLEAGGDAVFEPHLRTGFEYYKNTFFEDDGRPRYYHDRLYPIDSQCVGQAIETLAGFSDRDPDALALANKVAGWAIDNMQDPDGHFYHRVLSWKKVKTPMLHWSQGVIFKGLATLWSQSDAIRYNPS